MNDMIKKPQLSILLILGFVGCSDSNNPVQIIDMFDLPNIHWFVGMDSMFVEVDSAYVDTSKYSEIPLKAVVGFDDPTRHRNITIGIKIGVWEAKGGSSLSGFSNSADKTIDSLDEKLTFDVTFRPAVAFGRFTDWEHTILECEIYDNDNIESEVKRFKLIKLINSVFDTSMVMH